MRQKGWVAATVVFLLAVPASVVAQELLAQKALVSARYPEVQWVTTGALSRYLGRPAYESLVLLDAREPDEFRVSHLRGARRVDPDLEDVSTLNIDEEAHIVVYCSVGWRSGAFADRMRRAGHRLVYNLEGGIFRWANEGRRLVSGGRDTSVVHPYDATWSRMLNPERRANTSR
jgi:rhodanese-related sulfurtransferase